MDAEWKEGETSREEKLRGRCVPHPYAHTCARSNTAAERRIRIRVCVYTPMTTNRFSAEQVSVPIFGPPSLSKVLKLRPSQSLTFRSLLLSLNPPPLLDRERRSYWTWVIKTRGLWFFSLWWFLSPFFLPLFFFFSKREIRNFSSRITCITDIDFEVYPCQSCGHGEKFNRNR